MGMAPVLKAWAQELTAAGVAVLLDSRGQYSSPSGYILLTPDAVALPGTAAAPVTAGRGKPGPWLLSGAIYAVCDGPYGTAAAAALDTLVDAAVAVLGEHLDRVDYPNTLTLAALGIDQPAVILSYANVPVSIGA